MTQENNFNSQRNHNSGSIGSYYYYGPNSNGTVRHFRHTGMLSFISMEHLDSHSSDSIHISISDA